MIKFIYYGIFLISLILVFRSKERFLYFIPIFNVIVDTSFSFFTGFSEITYLRGLVLILFILITLWKVNLTKLNFTIYLFLFYVLLIVLNSNELLYSIKAYFQILIPFLIFTISLNYFDNENKIKNLLNISYLILPLSVVFTSAGYIYGIGRVLEYTLTGSVSEETVGLLGSGGQYVPGVMISMLPLLFVIRNKSDKIIWIYFAIGIINYIFIILNMRRTAILIPAIGLLPFIFISKHKIKFIKFIFIFFISLLLISPLYKDKLIKRYEIRAEKGRFDEDFYKTEARYTENIEMLEEIVKFTEPYKVLFGIGNNAFAEAIYKGEVVRRMYHSDTAKLYHSIGMFGLLFYFSIYVALLIKIYRTRYINPKLVYYKIAAFGLLFIQIFVSLNGSITIITFRTVTFLLIGSILGFLKNSKQLKLYDSVSYYNYNHR